MSLAALVRHDSRRRGLGVALGRLTELPRVGRGFARLAQAPNQVPALTPLVTRFHAWLLRRAGGSLRRSWLFAAGQPVISLTTVGRRSGKPRSTAVACFTEGEELVVAGMNLGRTNQPAWALNLIADPRAVITVRNMRIDVKARLTSDEERERLWNRWLELQPSAATFADLAERNIPLFVLHPAAAEPSAERLRVGRMAAWGAGLRSRCDRDATTST